MVGWTMGWVYWVEMLSRRMVALSSTAMNAVSRS